MPLPDDLGAILFEDRVLFSIVSFRVLSIFFSIEGECPSFNLSMFRVFFFPIVTHRNQPSSFSAMTLIL